MSPQTSQYTSEISSTITAAYPALPPRLLLVTVEQFSERNPAFTPPAVRNLIFKAESRQASKGEIPGNGLLEVGAILRIGRKVLIDEDRFFDWVRRQNVPSQQAARGAPHPIVKSLKPQRSRRNRGSPKPVCQQCNGSGTDPSTSDQCVRCNGSSHEPLDE